MTRWDDPPEAVLQDLEEKEAAKLWVPLLKALRKAPATEEQVRLRAIGLAQDAVALYLGQDMSLERERWVELCHRPEYADVAEELEGHYGPVKRMLDRLFR